MSAVATRHGVAPTVGRAALALTREVGATVLLLRRAVRGARGAEPGEAFRQAYELANRSLFFVLVIMSFTGAIMVIQACTQAERLLGDLSAIGPAFLQLLVREFGPTIVALMLAARYGAGVAAELGAMRITEQIDALRLTGAEPAGYLVAPRLAGGLVGAVPIVVFGSAIAFVAGGLAARYGFGIGWDTYFSLRLLGVGDVVVGIAKSLAFGIAVPAVACRAGLQARGGAPGVGRATTWAVIGGSTAVLFLDLAIGAVGYLLQR